jgi:Cu/Ag efflux pump CusA
LKLLFGRIGSVSFSWGLAFYSYSCHCGSVSLIGTLLHAIFDIPSNLITLFAGLAIGIVVDDAIVVIEAVHVPKWRKHLSALMAAKPCQICYYCYYLLTSSIYTCYLYVVSWDVL